MKFYYVTNIFDLHTFDNETTALLKLFEISAEMHFVSLFFLHERNIATSLLIIHLKCTFVHYANLNSSSMNKPYLRTVEYVISFFSISYLCYFNKAFVKYFMKKTTIFNTNFQDAVLLVCLFINDSYLQQNYSKTKMVRD